MNAEPGFDPFFAPDAKHVQREKEKAKKLRDSGWWNRKRADGICYYCRRKFKPNELTMDHLIPLSRGGSSTKENIVPCCKECNNRKKYLMPAEFADLIAKERAEREKAQSVNAADDGQDPSAPSDEEQK